MLWPLVGCLVFLIGIVLFLARRFDRLYAIEERRRAGLPWDDLVESRPAMLGCGWALIAWFSSLGFGFVVAELLGISFILSTFAIWLAIFGLGVLAYRRNRPL